MAEFIDYAASFIMQQQLAELYERMYPYAAEDWVAYPDHNKRQDNVDLHLTNLKTSLQTLTQWLQAHIHTSASPGSPTSPPTIPLIIFWPTIPTKIINATGSTTNLAGNKVTAFSFLSYTDNRTIQTNFPISVFRRQQKIPINTLDFTGSLIRR